MRVDPVVGQQAQQRCGERGDRDLPQQVRLAGARAQAGRRGGEQAAPVERQHRGDGAHLDADREHVVRLAFAEAEQTLRDDQVASARHRQELGHAFDETEHHRFEPAEHTVADSVAGGAEPLDHSTEPGAW